MAPSILLMKSQIDDTKRAFTSSRLIICITALWFVIIAFVIGFPELGANVGGLLTAIAVFSAALVVISGISITYRHGVIMFIIAIAAIIVFAAIDLYNTNSVSHLGRSISIAEKSGIINLMELILRKIVMHIGIITSPAAYCPILFGMPFVLMYARRVKNQSANVSVSDYINASTLPIIIIGVVVAFLFNDSGVVPASLFLGYYMASSIVLRLGEKICE